VFAIFTGDVELVFAVFTGDVDIPRTFKLNEL